LIYYLAAIRIVDSSSRNAVSFFRAHHETLSVAMRVNNPDCAPVLVEGRASGKPVGEPMKHDKMVKSAQFSPDGQRVLTTSRGWDGTGVGYGDCDDEGHERLFVRLP